MTARGFRQEVYKHFPSMEYEFKQDRDRCLAVFHCDRYRDAIIEYRSSYGWLYHDGSISSADYAPSLPDAIARSLMGT